MQSYFLPVVRPPPALSSFCHLSPFITERHCVIAHFFSDSHPRVSTPPPFPSHVCSFPRMTRRLARRRLRYVIATPSRWLQPPTSDQIPRVERGLAYVVQKTKPPFFGESLVAVLGYVFFPSLNSVWVISLVPCPHLPHKNLKRTGQHMNETHPPEVK